MTINEYQTEALRTAAGMNHPNNDEILLNGVMGLCGESGECVDMVMVCKCGGKEFFIEEHGNQTGLYCSACGKWQKWLKKDEIRLFNHGVKVENASLLKRLKARIAESAIKVSTVKAPHTYMKAVGTRELEKILEEELGNEDTK